MRSFNCKEKLSRQNLIPKDDLAFDDYGFDASIKKENPVEHAIMVKAAESDEGRLVG